MRIRHTRGCIATFYVRSLHYIVCDPLLQLFSRPTVHITIMLLRCDLRILCGHYSVRWDSIVPPIAAMAFDEHRYFVDFINGATFIMNIAVKQDRRSQPHRCS